MTDHNSFKNLLSDGRILLNMKNLFVSERSKDNLNMVLACLRDAEVFVPMNPQFENAEDEAAFKKAKETGEEFVASGNVSMKADILRAPGGNLYFPMFTMENQIPDKYRQDFTIVVMKASECIRASVNNKQLEGIIIDPFTTPMELPMPLANVVLEIPSSVDAEA